MAILPISCNKVSEKFAVCKIIWYFRGLFLVFRGVVCVSIFWYICSVNLMNYGRDKGCLGALDLGEEGLLFR